MKNQLNIVLEKACKVGLAEGVYSGVSAAVSIIKKGRRLRGWFGGGLTFFGTKSQPVQASTLFDLASLTKPLCTTLCTLNCIHTGDCQWQDTPLSIIDKNISNDKKCITIEDILHHTSGIIDYKKFYLDYISVYNKLNKYSLIQKIINEPLVYKRGDRCLYSDFGFILLGKIIEIKRKLSLDIVYKKEICDQINIKNNILFLPLYRRFYFNKNNVVATEYCSWRKRLLQGEVHDEHSWIMGGVAGHAGLFGTASGVMKICECLLDCWHDKTCHPAFSNEILHYALTKKESKESWLLGFDSPSLGESSSGRYFSTQSIGHLGFTGTSFWIDLNQQIIIVLLTNRVHPSRDNLKIRTFRPYFHDFVVEGIM
jgi:serine-type D-Ala-D-Ala carboxypeptidase